MPPYQVGLTVYTKKKNWKFHSNNQSFISQISKVMNLLREKFEFFSPLRFEIQINFDYETSKIRFHSIRASKRYLNEKI